MHHATFARIEPALKSFSDQISPSVMNDEGEMTRPWGESEASGAIVYGTGEVFFGPAAVLDCEDIGELGTESVICLIARM